MIYVVVMKYLIVLPLLIHTELLWRSRSFKNWGVGVGSFVYRHHSPGFITTVQFCGTVIVELWFSKKQISTYTENDYSRKCWMSWRPGNLDSLRLSDSIIRLKGQCSAKVSPDSLCAGLDSNLLHSLTVYVMHVVWRLVGLRPEYARWFVVQRTFQQPAAY
jgi:hypothetical protein